MNIKQISATVAVLLWPVGMMLSTGVQAAVTAKLMEFQVAQVQAEEPASARKHKPLVITKEIDAPSRASAPAQTNTNTDKMPSPTTPISSPKPPKK